MKIVLVDGICHLCNNIASFILKRDKKNQFRFVAMQSEEGEELLRKYGITEEQASTLFYIRDGICLKRSTAALYIFRDLGGFWKCFYPFVYLPAPIRDAIYSFISRNRYRFS